MRAGLVGLGALASLLAAPAPAKDPVFVEASPVKDKPAVTLDRSKAYLMVRSDMAVPLYLMKIPSAEDQAVYDKLRADALIKAHAKYAKKQASYDAAVRANAKIPKGDPRQPLPDKPLEPTEANFEFTPFNLFVPVAIGPLNRFAKGGGALSTYVEELTPGDYRVYGPLQVGPNGIVGSCFCMGSVRFAVRAGEITDLGVVMAKVAKNAFDKPDGDSSAPVPLMDKPYFAPSGTAPDPRLAALPVVPARFHAAGKLPNYFGVTITRISMPEVIRYDRDRIVDLTGG